MRLEAHWCLRESRRAGAEDRALRGRNLSADTEARYTVSRAVLAAGGGAARLALTGFCNNAQNPSVAYTGRMKTLENRNSPAVSHRLLSATCLSASARASWAQRVSLRSWAWVKRAFTSFAPIIFALVPMAVRTCGSQGLRAATIARHGQMMRSLWRLGC